MSNNAETDIKESIENLRTTKLKLLSIDKDELNQVEINELADALNTCSLNILKLENADLETLNENFKNKLPELKRVTKRMKNDLDNLTNTVEIIEAASAGLDIVTFSFNISSSVTQNEYWCEGCNHTIYEPACKRHPKGPVTPL